MGESGVRVLPHLPCMSDRAALPLLWLLHLSVPCIYHTLRLSISHTDSMHCVRTSRAQRSMEHSKHAATMAHALRCLHMLISVLLLMHFA